nr:hypothetical protein CFP56_07374 [Quercus suber]
MRLSPAIDSSPPIPIGSLYRRPIPIGSLSLTTRSFLPFSLSPLTTPIPIHFSSPYPYPYPFRFCLSDAEIVDAKPLVLSRGTLQTADSKEPFARSGAVSK